MTTLHTLPSNFSSSWSSSEIRYNTSPVLEKQRMLMQAINLLPLLLRVSVNSSCSGEGWNNNTHFFLFYQETLSCQNTRRNTRPRLHRWQLLTGSWGYTTHRTVTGLCAIPGQQCQHRNIRHVLGDICICCVRPFIRVLVVASETGRGIFFLACLFLLATDCWTHSWW